ncbi:MAG: pyruvate kinase [FCB group bacterium]|nr:pyruvate kinase [FCB group bacterium]
MKRTKIIATYGPAIASPSKLKLLIDAGVNLFRINCSHGKTNDFVKASDIITKAKSQSRFPIGLLLDISGPKLRVGRFEGKIPIKSGEKLTLTNHLTEIGEKTVTVNHPGIIKSIRKGEKVYIDDGNLIFKAITVGKQKIVLKALNNGTILPSKGINLPDSNIKIPTITEKDKEDIKTAVRVKADYIALSFVRSGDDIIEAQKIIKSYGGDQAIIAKLEKKEAIENLENIMLLADGVMVARGDLGVELPFEELPQLQKRIIKLANCHHKPVIVATQMLESMRFSPRATRAEINDVASAVFDFVDAVMLSAETATGQYPLEAVKAMSRVIQATEEVSHHIPVHIEEHLIRSEITHAIAKSVSNSTEQCPTKIIFAFTTSGFTAALISNLFPPQPVIALTPHQRVMNKLSLFRSVYPVLIKQPRSFEDMLSIVKTVCRKYRLAFNKDKIIITGGAPFGSTVPTNFMMFYEIRK